MLTTADFLNCKITKPGFPVSKFQLGVDRNFHLNIYDWITIFKVHGHIFADATDAKYLLDKLLRFDN